MNKVKRIISFLLVLFMLVEMIPPVTVHAEETVDESVVIETVECTTAPVETSMPTEPADAAMETTTVTEPEFEPVETTEPTVSGTEPTEETAEPTEETAASTEETIPAEETVPEYADVETAPAASSQIVASGDKYVKWELDRDGTLTFFGSTSIPGKESFRDYSGSYMTYKIPWAYYADDIKKIVVGDEITHIGENSLDFLENLTHVHLGKSVTVMPLRAFGRLPARMSYSVDPDNETYACDDRGVLFSKDMKTLIDCPSGMTGVYTIPEGVTIIEQAAFYNCSNLTGVIIPDSVVSIGRTIRDENGRPTTLGPFNVCAGLTSITIPDSVTEIGDNAFGGCENLTSVTIEGNGSGSGTSIGIGAFSSCKNLTNLTIGNGVTTIDSGAFQNLISLTSVTIPDSVTKIGKEAFKKCEKLESVKLGSSVAFIGEGAFSRCDSLSDITIPKSVETIVPKAFEYCYSLEKINVQAGNATYSSKDGVLYSQNGQVLHTFPGGKTRGSFSVPEGVTTIGTYSFYACPLDRVILPEGVTTIEAYAFCAILLNDTYIVRSIVVPKSVTTIGRYGFYGNSYGLRTEDIYYLGDETEWKKINIDSTIDLDAINIFYNGKIESGILGENLRWDYYVSGSLNISGNGEMPDFENTWDIPWFLYNKEIEKVVIRSGVTRIGSNSFMGCTAVKQVALPKGLKTIAKGAFSDCKGLKTVIFHGQESDYKEITIGEDNDPLTKLTPKYQYLSDYVDNSSIQTNGAGSAYAYYQGEPNQNIAYNLYGEKHTTTANDHGIIAIPLGTFRAFGENVVEITLLKVGDLELDPPQKMTAKVTVNEFSFSQSWKVSFDAKVKKQLTPGISAVEIPGFEAELNLFSASASASGGVSSEMSRTYANGKDSLKLMTSQSASAGASLKSGITNKDKKSLFTWPSASAGVKFGGTLSFGIQIDDYQKDNLGQNLAIGTFFLEHAMMTVPATLIFRDFYMDARDNLYSGLGVNSMDGSGVSVTVDGQFTNGSEKVNGKTVFDMGSIGSKLTIGLSESSNSKGESSRSTFYKSSVTMADILSGDMLFNMKREGIGLEMASQDITLTSKTGKNEKSLQITSIDKSSAKVRVFMYNQMVPSDWNEYTFSEGSLAEIMSNSSVVRNYVNGTNYVLSLSDIADIAKGVSQAYAPIAYKKQRREERIFSLPIELKVPGKETGIGLTVSSLTSSSAPSESGFVSMDEKYVVSENSRTYPYGYEKWDIGDFLMVAFNSVTEFAKGFFEAVKNDVKEGVQTKWAWVKATGTGIYNWSAEIIGYKDDTQSRSSMVSVAGTAKSAAALNSGIRSSTASEVTVSKAATVGRVFYVSVIDDDTGTYLDDFSVQPLEFTIRYTEEDLLAAGIDKTDSAAGQDGIAMYRCADNGSYFEYVGGVNNPESLTVTAKITKRGQYVLAVDTCAPSLTALDISDFGQMPTITAYVDDLSGLDMDSFVFILDGAVKVDCSNIADHYDSEAGQFTYTVTAPLAEGEHSMTFTLADTTGNSETYEYTFPVDLTAAVIEDVTVTGFTNEGSVVEIRAKVTDANLTRVDAVLSKQLPDGTWSDEVSATMGDLGDGQWGLDYEGDGSSIRVRVVAQDIGENTTESETFEAHPFAESVSIPQDYLLLNVDETVQLTADTQPAELAAAIVWTVEDGGENIISVDGNGNVTALQAGTAYVITSVFDGNVTLTDRCRIDVAEPVRLDGVQLSTDKLSVELYSTDYEQAEILLQLPQNYASASASTSATKSDSMGAAITNATFTDSTMAELFDIVALDDRAVAVVPTQTAFEDGKNVLGKYTGSVTVTVHGKEYVTQDLTLTVKKSLPRLNATIDGFNSFWASQCKQIRITGATATEISCDNLPNWLSLNEGTLMLTENVPVKGGSAKLTLLVKTEEWAIPVETTLTVKCSYKAPGLKLSASSVQLAGADSEGVKLQLLSKDKNLMLSDLSISSVSAPEGYEVSNYNGEDGSFVFKAKSGFRAGKINLAVSFSDSAETITVPLTVKVTPVTLKLSRSSITLNSGTSDSAAVSVTVTPADFRLRAPVIRLVGADKSDKLKSGELELRYDNGKLYIGTTDTTPDNAKYTLYISVGSGKEAAVKISTTGAEPSLKLKAAGNLDLSFPERKIPLTTVFKNHSGGNLKAIDYMVTETSGKTVLNEDVKYFSLTQDSSDLFLVLNDTAGINIKNTYTLHLTLTLEDGSILQSSVKIPVKQTSISLKLSGSKVTLNNTIADKVSVAVTCHAKGYNFTKPVWQLMDGKGKESADGKLDIDWIDGKLAVSVNNNTEFGASYKLMIRAAEGAKATALTVSIPAKNKSDITGSLKLTGTLDVIRNGTAITVMPSWKNCADAERKENLTVLNSDGEDVTNCFRITEQNGFYLLSRAGGAMLDHTRKFSVVLTADFGNGVKAEASSSLKLKMGSAKLTANTDNTALFAKDKNSRISISFVSADTALNAVANVQIKDAALKEQFEIFDYGNGQYAIGFKDGKVPPKVTSVNLPLEIWLDGNETSKANASVKIKINLVR